MYCEKHAKQRYQGPGSSPQTAISPRHWVHRSTPAAAAALLEHPPHLTWFQTLGWSVEVDACQSHGRWPPPNPPPLPIHVSITQYYGSHFCLLYNDIRSFGFVLDEVKPLHSVQVNPALMFHSCHEQTDITTGLLTDLAGLLFLTEDLDNGFNPLTEQRDHNFTSTACLIKMALHCRCSLQCGWVQVFTCRSILALVCFHWMCVFDREMGRSSYTKSPLGLLYVCKWNWWEKKMKRKKHKCCGAVLILTREIYSFTISFVIVFNDVNHYKIFSQDI